MPALAEDDGSARDAADPHPVGGEIAEPGEGGPVPEGHRISPGADEEKIEGPRAFLVHARHGGPARGLHRHGLGGDMNPAVKRPPSQKIGRPQRLHHGGIGHQREAGDEQQANGLRRVGHVVNLSAYGFHMQDDRPRRA